MNMNIAIPIGHSILSNGTCTSASGVKYGGVSEYHWDKEFAPYLKEELEKKGNTCKIVQVPEYRYATKNGEYQYKIPIVNNGTFDLIVELHLNATRGAKGTEVWYYPTDEGGHRIAENICGEMNNLGFTNRGAKKAQGSQSWYMVCVTNPRAVLVESFFCDTDYDCDLARRQGYRKLAKAIANGIDSTEVKEIIKEEDKKVIEDKTSFVGKSNTVIAQMEAWAIKKNAIEFAKLAKPCYDVCEKMGLNPAIVYAQSALETGYCYKNGSSNAGIDISYHNPCGLKTRKGGSDTDKNAHSKFKSWEDGYTAMCQHLLLYYGKDGYPLKDSLDPRNFSSLFGKAKTVIDLGGEGKWNSNPNYGMTILNLYKDLIKTSYEKEVVNKDIPETGNIVVYSNVADLPSAMIVGRWLKYPMVFATKESDVKKYKNIIKIGGGFKPKNTIKQISGNDRFETAEKALEFVEKEIENRISE